MRVCLYDHQLQYGSFVPRPLPDFISQPIFLHSCTIKSGSGLGMRLAVWFIREDYSVNLVHIPVRLHALYNLSNLIGHLYRLTQQKADRAALEGKASRDWVDSTFERLDREIRDARSKLMGQEEAFRSAVSQLTDDVDGKLDRLELEPLKAYFGW